MAARGELPVIQRTYDFILWAVPWLGRLPRDHKFQIGDRITDGLYGLLEGLLQARYARDKAERLSILNGALDVLRYQFRLLLDLKLVPVNRYEFAAQALVDIGRELGGWRKASGPRAEGLSQ